MARFFCFMVSALIGLAGIASPVAGQPPAPSFHRVIEGDLMLPDGSLVRFSALEGSTVVIYDKASKSRRGIMPVFQGGRLRVIPFNFSDQKPGDKMIRLGRTIDVGSGGEMRIVTEDGFLSIAIRSILPSLDSTQFLDSYTVDNEGAVDEVCCVSCGAITVCGGSVAMSCDSCGGRHGFEAM